MTNEDHSYTQNPTDRVTRLTTGLIISIIILALLAGAAGGVFGGLYLSKYYPKANGQNVTTNNVVQESSAIIDVVHKATPAVVSIVISKNVNQFQNNSLFSSPFFLDPFIQPSPQSPDNNNAAPTTPDFEQVGAGSGFFVSSDGLILTNKHVVSDTTAKYTVFTSDGKKYDATVLSTDPINDLALVKINITNAPTLVLADSSQIQIGEQVVAIGDSLGQYSNTVTSGIVSGINRDITAGGEGTSEELEGVIQTDAAINPGNSGGPLLNLEGQVIGMNTAIDQEGQLVGFAIPSNDAQKDIQSFQKYGVIKKPFLGVQYVQITPAIQQDNNLPVDYGAWLTSALNPGDNSGGNSSDGSTAVIVPGSAADKAGLKAGDIILSIGGTKIDENNPLAELIKNYNPGDSVALSVLRGSKTLNINVVLGEK